ncbi:sigma-70 family RNA polymerase sigma factor [Leucobacter coleopterorum]|uniref:Sigma-70 family RNA polymerase sigma factor n=1 Tax=Leucobacter coleopterorum TaxID=2714933 RepID=A0ABX6JU41_9MICO|nr:sigma-70 family RNA polymerase sigma factor [Leucobacter coleopterorum]QIM17811.1 sigma-70 family RNA polymerase sigma factor [Leucobacter coleopterorum]
MQTKTSDLRVGAEPSAPTMVGDADLLRDYRAGDKSALAKLHERYFRALVARAYRLVQNPADAEDFASEAFFQVIRAIDSGKGPTVSMWRYLLTTVRSVAITHSSRYDAITLEPHEIQEQIDLQTSMPNERTLDDTVTTAFLQLPERWQLVIWYREVEGYSQRETAKVLGIAENAVGVLSHRARRGFRAEYLKAVLRSDSSRSCTRLRQQLVKHHSSRTEKPLKLHPDLEQHLEHCRACKGVLVEAHEVTNRFGRAMSLALIGTALGGTAAGGLALNSAEPASAAPLSSGLAQSTALIAKKSILTIAAVVAVSIIAVTVVQIAASDTGRVPAELSSTETKHPGQKPLVLDFPVEKALREGSPEKPIQVFTEKVSDGSCGVKFVPASDSQENAYFEQSAEGHGECHIRTSRNGAEISDFQMGDGVQRIYVKRADTYAFAFETDLTATRTLTFRLLPELLES